ncbi:MAG: flagellar biosynthesis protein FlhB [Methylococcaceae bacterium]|nr:flagellar biosynthesis protein FlhB [Methylococcaceae bacterium]MDZ4158072.1 flagellar biosynthesis protein FlhB [Methylococcales bacterium]MDP2392863.1 flagellar biosynthesis protein FlhB [Methylococcaceae bacterium]MDP3020391.1 flagellar biosynthesis protein FlhB [Methylococcaceae bacterium]MDP3391998.1 flagellar biosynthesis protein FlhB [Methylococcaceae bacterium]
MADDSDQEKTEEPTGKRLADAKKKGQIARSRELNTFVMLMVSAALFWMQGKSIGQGLIKMMRTEFQLKRETIFDPVSPVQHFQQTMIDGVMLIAPFLAVLLVAAILAPLALGGWIFNWDAVSPKPEKMDPIKGMARLFAIRGLVEMGKALLKIGLVFIVAYLLYNSFIVELLGLGNESLADSIPHALNIIATCFLLLSASLVLVAMIDVPYQLWDHNKKLKMTLQEIKDENKESEGSPEVKGRQRRMQMDMAQKRMMAEVPKADVIITNPSHYAVALKYDQNGGGAPKLVAKGVDLIAAQIRNLAMGAEVPLVASPPLARALYYSTELDKEIPQGLYLAVAQILAYVYQLKTAQQNKWAVPMPPGNIKVPDEFRQD